MLKPTITWLLRAVFFISFMLCTEAGKTLFIRVAVFIADNLPLSFWWPAGFVYACISLVFGGMLEKDKDPEVMGWSTGFKALVAIFWPAVVVIGVYVNNQKAK